MVVPNGGSSCAKCEYYKSGNKCGEKHFIQWNGSDLIPAPGGQYCCDFFESQMQINPDDVTWDINANDVEWDKSPEERKAALRAHLEDIALKDPRMTPDMLSKFLERNVRSSRPRSGHKEPGPLQASEAARQGPKGPVSGQGKPARQDIKPAGPK
jgi:hypothetical protein